MEQIITHPTLQHVQDSCEIRVSPDGFMKGRSWSTNLLSCDEVTLLVDKAVDVVYLDISKAFDTVSHCNLLEKLGAHGLSG